MAYLSSPPLVYGAPANSCYVLSAIIFFLMPGFFAINIGYMQQNQNRVDATLTLGCETIYMVIKVK